MRPSGLLLPSNREDDLCHVDDLTPEQREQLGVKAPRETNRTKEGMRSWALKILASTATLSRAERTRVLAHAQKVNAV